MSLKLNSAPILRRVNKDTSAIMLSDRNLPTTRHQEICLRGRERRGNDDSDSDEGEDEHHHSHDDGVEERWLVALNWHGAEVTVRTWFYGVLHLIT